MMQKRTMYSLLLISFMVAFAASLSFANSVTVEEKSNILRCTDQAFNVAITADQALDGFEIVLEITGGPDGGFFEVTSVDWDAGLVDLQDRVVDLSQVDGVSPDFVRFAAMKLQPGDTPLGAGTLTVATVNFHTNDNCGDSVSIDNGVVDVPLAGITTQFVLEATNDVVPVAVDEGFVLIANSAPSIDPIPDATIHWGDFFSYTPTYSDDDASECEELSFTKVSGPDDLDVNIATGKITWQTVGADVCNEDAIDITVRVTDLCGATDDASFTICVENDPPELTCHSDVVTIPLGYTLDTAVTGFDPDGGPYALVYSLVSFSGPGTPVVNPATGEITWETQFTPEYSGLFEICVAVSDQAEVCDPCSPSNSAECCFSIEVIPMQITIEKVHMAIQGKVWSVDVTALDAQFNNYPIGGYNFLIAYDASALAFQEAVEGQFLLDCGWEYFTYRYGADGNCDGACPSGLLRVVAMAETNNGGNHPDCYTIEGDVSNVLTTLKFLVSDDRTLECQYVPIRFFWYECADNSISSMYGDTLFISDSVFAYDGVGNYINITNLDADMPSYTGAPAPLCDQSDKGYPVRAIRFLNGGIDIACADSIDAVGDVNVNGIAYEVADAVMFTRYFVEGLSAFLGHEDASVAASDTNKDGIPLTVADLVYLIRVVVGDAEPYPKEAVAEMVNYTHSDGVLATQSNVEIGAAYLVVAGDVSPILLADNMEISYAFDGENTRIIVTPSLDNNVTEGFTGEFLAGVNADIVNLEMVTVAGMPVVATNVPTDYSLSQNYPNPFNPTTTIQLSTPVAGAYDLTIYNIQGQVVEVISGAADGPGVISIEWDASDHASGVYLYRLEINQFSSVKKMVLLK